MKKNCLIKYSCLLALLPTISFPLRAGTATPDEWTIDEDGNYTLDEESSYTGSVPFDGDAPSTITITENGIWTCGSEESPIGYHYLIDTGAYQPNLVINGQITAYSDYYGVVGTHTNVTINTGADAEITFNTENEMGCLALSWGDITSDSFSGSAYINVDDYSNMGWGIIASNVSIGTFDGSIYVNRVSLTDNTSEGLYINSAISAEVANYFEGTPGNVDITTLSGTVAIRTDNNATDEDVLSEAEENKTRTTATNDFSTTQATIYGNEVTIGALSGTITSDVEATGTFDTIEIEAASILGETSISIENLTGTIATTVDVDNESTSSEASANISVYALSTGTPTESVSISTSEETEENESITINAFGADASVSAILNIGNLTAYRPIIEVAAISSYDVTISDVNGTIAAAINGNSIEDTSSSYFYDDQISSYAISAENDISLGNINGSITSTIYLETISCITDDEIQNIAIYSDNGNIIIGDIAEDATITSDTSIGTASTAGSYNSQYHYSRAIYSNYDLTIGDVAGLISGSTGIATASSGYIYGYAYALEAEGLSIGDIEGTISSSANISEVIGTAYVSARSYARTISGMVTTLGDVSGNILATAIVGDTTNEDENAYARSRSYAISSETVTIDAISGTIAATATTGDMVSGNTNNIGLSAEANAIDTDQLVINQGITGTISATATNGNISTESNHAYNESYAFGIMSYSSTEIEGTSEGSSISAVATAGNLTYTGEEELSSYDYYGSAYAYALSAGSGSLGTLNGDITATATVGAGYNRAYAYATGITSSGSGGKDTALSTLKTSKDDMSYSSDGILTIDAINGNITVLADTTASDNTDINRVNSTGIALGASTASSDSEDTENYIGSISGVVDVTSKVGNYYGFYGYVNTIGISSSSSSGGLKKTTSSKLVADEGDDDSSTVGLDLHIGTLDGSINVTTEVGNGTGVTPFRTIGIQGFTGTDEYAHNLIIDTLSGDLTVNSTIGFTTFEMVESDLGLIDTLLSYDYLPLNVAVGITDSAYDTEQIIYNYGYDLQESEINISDLSGSITVNATTLAVDFSDYIANYLEEGSEAPSLHQVYTEVAGIITDHSDVNITDFSGDISVSVTTPELEEDLNVDSGTVVVSGITAKAHNVNIENFTGNITVSGTIEGEGTVVATGISASEISGNYAGNVSVTSDDYAIGMILWNEPEEESTSEETTETELASSEFTIDGTLSAEGAEGQTYAIYSGYFDFEEATTEETESKTGSAETSDSVEKELVLVAGESNETVNITTNASITGAIDLTGGDDTINLIDSSSVETSGIFSTDIYNVEAVNVLSGTWSFDNDYNYSTVTINGGTLTYSADADIEGISMTSGTLATTAGTLSNVGTLSSGTFQVSGTGAWSDLTLNGATLDLQRSYDLNSETITYTSGTILLNGSETDKYNWGISTITSGQTVTLNNGLFMSSTDVTVDGGSFVFNGGSIDLNYNTYDLGNFTVPEGATVYGIGTIVGDVTNNGTIIPGYSPGTISITGNFVQSETGRLVMEIDGTDYDVINVSGTAQVGGSLDLTTGELENNVEYTLIAASEEVQGEFTDVVIQATREAEVTYDPTSIYVELSHINYTEFAENVGQYTVGGTLDQVFEIAATDSLLGGLIATVDDFMDSSDVTDFLGQLAAPMSMNTGWLVEQGSDVMNLIKDQQSQTPAGSYVWAKAIHENMDFQSYENYGERDGDYNGAVAGFSMQVGESWSLGAAVSGIDGSLDNETQSKYDNETTSLWLLATHYVASENNGWSKALRFGAGYSDVDVDAYDRFIFNGDHINASYKGESYSGFAEFAMNKQFGSWKIEPSAGITYQRHTDDAHSDMLNGEVLRTWDDVTSKSIKGTLGCRAMYVIEMASAKLIPFANVRFEYQFEDQPEGTFTWGGTSISGTLESAEWDEQTLRLGAGLMYLLDNGWSTSLSGDYLEGDSHDAYGVNAGFSYSF